MSEKLSVKKRIVKIANLLRLEKDGINTFGGYDYFKPDSILAAINPLLEEYDLFTKFELKVHPTKENYYLGELTIEDVDTEDGKQIYEFDIEKAEVKGANKAQNSGATLTYAKRYSLMNAFNIADNNDDYDSNKMSELQKKNANNTNIKKSTKDRINDMVNVFKKEFDVSKEQIEKFIGKKVENINDAELSKLSVVYSNIKSGKNKKEEYFK